LPVCGLNEENKKIFSEYNDILLSESNIKKDDLGELNEEIKLVDKDDSIPNTTEKQEYLTDKKSISIGQIKELSEDEWLLRYLCMS
jgi:hypothetical protein